MAHPSTTYVRYLIVKALSDGELDANTEEDYDRQVRKLVVGVNRTLRQFNLVRISDNEFVHLLDNSEIPESFQFRNKRHSASAKFMAASGLTEAWNFSDGFRLSLELLHQPKTADIVKLLLVGGLKDDEISRKIGEKSDLDVPTDGVSMYRKYFWNAKSVSEQEWEHLLAHHPHQSRVMASFNGGRTAALFHSGFDPEIDEKGAIKDVYRILHFRAKSTMHLPDNKETAEILARLAKEMVAIHQALYGEGSELEEVLKKFKMFKMGLKESGVKSINEIAPNGNYSGSGSFLSLTGKGSDNADA